MKTYSTTLARAALALITALACSADPPHLRPTEPTGPNGPIGTLLISVAGLLPSARSGGRIEVIRVDIEGQPIQIADVSPNGTASLDLFPGTYTVTYLPPSGYRAVSYTRSPVVVPANVTTAVAFDVTVAFGTLEIVANVLSAPYPQSGGTASILRTDLVGQTPISVVIPLIPSEGYYTWVNLEVGTYTVTYTPPTGYYLPGGVTSTFTGVVVADPDNWTVVSFDVTH